MDPRRHGRERRGTVPGFGWSPRLSGLEHRGQWMGFFLTVVAVLVIAMIIAVVAFG